MSIASGNCRRPMMVCACTALLALSATGEPEVVSRKNPVSGLVAVAINVFSPSAGPKEAVALVVAVASSGKEPVHVPKIDARTITIELYDAKGRWVAGDPVATPPLPRVDPYIIKQGKRVLTSPVWKLEAGSGAVVVVPDALKRYHKHIGKGIYTIRVRVASGIYDPNSIIRRQETKHKLWADTRTRPTGPRQLKANEIRIRIE